MARLAERINIELRKHQAETDDWQYRLVIDDLHVWAERFILEYKLQTSTPAITIEYLKRNADGHFRRGRNGFGLRNEIAIREGHLRHDKYWEVLGTLLHELLHGEQENVGKPGRRNYHNIQFRKRAAELGLIVDDKGCQEYAKPPSRFLDLLARYHIKTPDLPEPRLQTPSSRKSKLKPWICGCRPRPIHVQVAVQDFQARCLKCGQMFVRKSRNGEVAGDVMWQIQKSAPYIQD